MGTFIERIKRDLSGRVKNTPYVKLNTQDVEELIYHFERLGKDARYRHQEEHPECYPPEHIDSSTPNKESECLWVWAEHSTTANKSMPRKRALYRAKEKDLCL